MRLKSREKIKKKLLQKLQGITVLFQKQIKSYEKEFNNNRAIFPEVQETIGENAKLEMEKQLKNQKNYNLECYLNVIALLQSLKNSG